MVTVIGAEPFDLAGRRVFVAGHRGMVGAALVRRLQSENCEILCVGREQVDLRRQSEVEDWLTESRPEVIFLAAATVGGIHANSTRPADFLFDNLAITTNVIHGAYKAGVRKLMAFGSNCVYPREAPQPLKEEYILTGPLEPTNQWYAVAKIAGIKLCDSYRIQHGCDYISVQPAGLFGPDDNFDPVGGHVLPSLFRRLHEAKLSKAPSVEIWGSGRPLREFLFIDDAADAAIFLMRQYSEQGPINIGAGEEISIRDLAVMVAEVVGYEGELIFDSSKPDGMMRKLLDGSRLASMGWTPRIGFREGLATTYRWFVENGDKVRRGLASKSTVRGALP